MFHNMLSFALLAGVLTLIPGIDTAQILRSSMTGGKRAGFITMFGIIAGVYVWGIGAALGISALLLASHAAYTAIKIIGGFYLLYLGIKIIRDSRKITHQSIEEQSKTSAPFWKVFSRALIITITNPKNGVFYIAVLPQFLPDGYNPILGGFLLASTHNVMVILWQGFLVLATNFAGKFIRNPRAQKIIERIAGVTLVGFAARIAAEK
jgi:threonine/homoserine/homoserine lactone efflux protein